MFLFATLIYYGENPAGYDVYREEGMFRFEPAIGSEGSPAAPPIRAVYERSGWIVEGVDDIDVIQQVNRIIEVNDLLRTHPLGAAS